jgi:Zn-dependent protease/CBS domain-containing protein
MTASILRKPVNGNPQPPNRPASQRSSNVIPLGRWAGIRFSARWSVLATLVLFADLLATSALPSALHGQSAAAYWVVGIITAFVFLATLLVHELAHAIAARHYRMPVKQVTLWMLGGVTELEGDPPSARADLTIAAAGPVASFAIGGVCVALSWWVGSGDLFGAALGWLGAVSILLGVFNMLPGAPLDGGRVLRALLWWRSHDRARAADRAARVGTGLGLLLIALGMLEFLGGAVTGLWLAFIGWFIVTSATAERCAARTQGLRDVPSGEVMTAAPVVAHGWWTVEQFLASLPQGALGQPGLPVVDFAGRVTGAITLNELERASDKDARIRDLGGTRRLPPLVVHPDDPVENVVLRLRLHGGLAVVVDEEQHPIGLISEADLERAAHAAAARTVRVEPAETR